MYRCTVHCLLHKKSNFQEASDILFKNASDGIALHTLYTVHVKKNAKNVAWWHLKTWRHLWHFSSTKSVHFDGHATVRRLVKHLNTWIVAPFAVKMWHVRRIAACLAKRATIPYLSAYHTNHKSVAQFS